MRVALVFPGCSRQGGVERIMWEAARFLARRHEVLVVSMDSTGLPEGVLHRRPSLGMSSRNPLAFRRAAAATLDGLDADLVISDGSQCPPGDVWVVNSVHRAWLAHAGPIVMRGHQVDGRVRYLLPKHAQALWLERTYYGARTPRHLVPCSAQVATDLATYYRVGDVPTTVVPNGFAPEEFGPERRLALRATKRAELGYGEADVVAIMVANEWQRKGLPTLLRALRRLDDRTLHLLLAGRAPPDPVVRGLVGSLGGRVRYVGSAKDVGALLTAADVFVMPTQYEAFSLAVVEALASGLGVLTTDVPGAADAVEHGVNGLLLQDPLDDKSLSEHLEVALDPAVRSAWSRAAGPSVAPYSWERLMPQFERVLLEAGAPTASRPL
jgi:UDP-glucose:(heptosyl)LPS alpha-1,3-glucosyltransferase